MVDPNLLSRLALLRGKKKELKAELSAVEDEMRPVQEAVMDQMASAGQSTIKQGGVTYSISERTWVSYETGRGEGTRPTPEERAAFVRSLLDLGYDHVTNFNHMSLTSEFGKADPDEIPPEIRDRLRITKEPRISVRGV